MQTNLECIPCLVRQTLKAARFMNLDRAMREDLLRRVLRQAADMDLNQSPPVMARDIHRMLRLASGNPDPYAEPKRLFNAMALDMLPGLAQRVAASDDPLREAVAQAIAGNTIDLGVNGDLTEAQARQAMDEAAAKPLAGDFEAFRKAVNEAEDILYLADNAGEIVFDQLLIRQLGPERVTVAVRGNPVLNDATRQDARDTGLDALVEVVDNGSDAPGTLLEDCSPEFRRRFERAGLILAKGQGNYESLSGGTRDVFFLFKVKCQVVAERTGLPEGSHALLRPGRLTG